MYNQYLIIMASIFQMEVVNEIMNIHLSEMNVKYLVIIKILFYFIQP